MSKNINHGNLVRRLLNGIAPNFPKHWMTWSTTITNNTANVWRNSLKSAETLVPGLMPMTSFRLRAENSEPQSILLVFDLTANFDCLFCKTLLKGCCASVDLLRLPGFAQGFGHLSRFSQMRSAWRGAPEKQRPIDLWQWCSFCSLWCAPPKLVYLIPNAFSSQACRVISIYSSPENRSAMSRDPWTTRTIVRFVSSYT